MSPATQHDNPAARVLIVEDEAPLASLAAKYLQRDRHQVRIIGEGAAAVRLAREFDPDVIVLDLGLPDLDGLEVCRQLRQFTDCYIVMLTARDDEVDKLVGLAIGADDYLTKPFSPRELAARVTVMLRRPRRSVASAPVADLRIGALSINPGAHEVRLDGDQVALTPTEFELLLTLAGSPNLVLSRRQLIEAVWGGGWVGDERMVDVHIRNLRRKLDDDPADPRFIRTIRGAGYRIGDGG